MRQYEGQPAALPESLIRQRDEHGEGGEHVDGREVGGIDHPWISGVWKRPVKPR